MTDRREKQPEQRTVDFKADTRGNNLYAAEINVWPYFSLRNEDVYSRSIIAIFKADDMRDAHGTAQVISATISLAHDVWQTNVKSISRGDEA